MKEQVEGCLNMPPTYHTVVSRAQLAQHFYDLAKNQRVSCERLVYDQHLQQQGWAAVVANLEDIARNGENAHLTANLFNQRYPNKHCNAKYILELVQKFKLTGSVANKKRTPGRELPVRNEATEIEILGQVAADPTLSIRKLEAVTSISRTSICRILKTHKFHPYKINLVHQLNKNDFDRRQRFCEIMTERLRVDVDYLFNICFSDECTFFLNSTVNRHNCRY
ncbi:uncharacterized protein LOC111632943 [Centruroides sculpturatus]|uniref:uncharacterized protein LOC111632943 n=1 Tax=Centruroides sculpturatus TaxID=218467 RepID=UPI000C6D329D|nr:uncharacterized protein LOC111632943 [Centruroides sculpturatus]